MFGVSVESSYVRCVSVRSVLCSACQSRSVCSACMCLMFGVCRGLSYVRCVSRGLSYVRRVSRGLSYVRRGLSYVRCVSRVCLMFGVSVEACLMFGV